jgi:hypothetical protein
MRKLASIQRFLQGHQPGVPAEIRRIDERRATILKQQKFLIIFRGDRFEGGFRVGIQINTECTDEFDWIPFEFI